MLTSPVKNICRTPFPTPKSQQKALKCIEIIYDFISLLITLIRQDVKIICSAESRLRTSKDCPLCSEINLFPLSVVQLFSCSVVQSVVQLAKSLHRISFVSNFPSSKFQEDVKVQRSCRRCRCSCFCLLINVQCRAIFWLLYKICWLRGPPRAERQQTRPWHRLTIYAADGQITKSNSSQAGILTRN